MAAPYKNKNAEKWKFRKAVCLFNDAIELSKKKEIIKDKDGNESEAFCFDFIGEVATNLGTFHLIFTHLVKRFPILKRKHDLLINNLEQNCYFNTKKGKINTAVGIVNLKSNHKWTDREQIDHTTNGKEINNVNLSTLTTEELIKRAEAMKKLE